MLTFRYKAALLINYDMKKERLIVGVNNNINSKTLIALITKGLPEFIMKKINKEEGKDSKTFLMKLETTKEW